MTNDEPFTDDELNILKNAGYALAGGGTRPDGIVRVRFRKDGETLSSTRTEWRAIIAELNKPTTEDEIAFGKDAWVYCSQHMRAHQTGWCSVSPRDKVGLGVKTAAEAYDKCRAWKFELYEDVKGVIA